MNCCHSHRAKCLLDSLLMTNTLCEWGELGGVGLWGQEVEAICASLCPQIPRGQIKLKFSEKL